MELYSTRGVPATRKVAYWNAVSSEAFAAMEVTPRNTPAFDGELYREAIGPLTLMDVRSAAVRIRHTRTHIGQTPSPSYLLVTPLRGTFELTVDQSAAFSVATGEFCLIDHARPYVLQHGDAVRTLCLDIPRATLNALLPLPAAVIGQHMRPISHPSRILVSLLRELGEEIYLGAATRYSAAFAQGLLGFIVAAYGADHGPGTPATAQARRRAVLARIEARLYEPTLVPEDIAQDVGVCSRTLRAILADGGESFSNYVRRRRLDRCAALLSDPAWQHWSITRLAFHTGFNNATHFGCAFKKHFGVTPRDYRARVQ